MRWWLQHQVPFGLNFWSMLFFVPSVAVGLALECPQVAYGAGACLITGLLYHGTYNKTFRRIDQGVLSACVVYFLAAGQSPTRHFGGACLCAALLLVGYCTLSHRASGVLYHSLLHFISNIGICMLTVGCSQTKCPLSNAEGIRRQQLER